MSFGLNKPSPRFHALDGLRGIAAIAVTIYHFAQHNGLHWLPGAWVAVDLFFILSGFVIAHSYGERISSGMKLGTFMRFRLVRLAPLYVAGICLGVLSFVVYRLGSSKATVNWGQFLIATALNAIGLPYLNSLDWPIGTEFIDGVAFPINDPAWSLHFEWVVNVLFFLYWASSSHKRLGWITFASFFVFMVFTIGFRIVNPGWGTVSFFVGYIRVIYEFLLGVCLYQLHTRVHRQGSGSASAPAKKADWFKERSLYLYQRYRGRLSAALIVVMGILLILPWARVGLINGLLLAPLLIFFLSDQQLSKEKEQICAWLGAISYPLYISHFPVSRFFLSFESICTVQPPIQLVALCIVAFAVAWMLNVLDSRVRRLLSRAT